MLLAVVCCFSNPLALLKSSNTFRQPSENMAVAGAEVVE